MVERVTARDQQRRRQPRTFVRVLAGVAILAACLFKYGGFFLISDDPLPGHIDAAVVLQGSIAGENARVAGAVRLLEAGTASRIVLSVPRESYWGESSLPAAREYMQKKYGIGGDGRLEFCETDPEVNSTEDEAKAVSACLRQHAWPTIAVVTSDYHTRRAGLIWRRVMRSQDPDAQLWIHGVDDPEFDARDWWRRRIYAKTAFLESTKLVWTLLTTWL